MHLRNPVPAGYDLILTDIQMPVMNGYDAVRAIRAGRHPHAKIIPIIAMTTETRLQKMLNRPMPGWMPMCLSD